MKVKDLIKLLQECDQNADITSIECKWFIKKSYYYPVVLDYIKKDEISLECKDCSPKEANLILIH